MELIRGLHNLQARHHGCVATIGNFDGVHQGHQAVIRQLAVKGQELGLPATVIIFEPQPLEFFQPLSVPPRLTRLREKLQAFMLYAVDRVLCVRFDAHFADIEAGDFIERVLINGLGVKYLFVGDDFRFGRGRQGDYAMLQRAGKDAGFKVATIPTYNIDDVRVSSTRVRRALEHDDLDEAGKLLGRRYRMSGRVVHGNKIGASQLGIPTANVHLHRRRSPLHGIFVTEVTGLGHKPLAGAASIGTRPTVGGTRVLLEVHLLDFDKDIYGQYLQVNFLHKLRDEEKYDTMAQLKTHMLQDIAETRVWFDVRTQAMT